MADHRFFDEVNIYVKAGDGGNGCCSFRRVKYIPRGGSDGGNGGDGGNVILEASNNLNTLLYFHYNVHHRGENGKSGAGANMQGASGEDKIIKTPIGTQIYNQDGSLMLADLSKDGEKFVIAKGGRGGIGNMMFKTSVNQAPRKATPGEKGEEGWFKLKLKMISDVGLVGLPNAGKSSLITTLTNAKSQIGDYPFTTLKPILGVLRRGRGKIVLCDIPGLIENAHQGVGLGDKFLKHIERCKILLHILDVSSANLNEDYKAIKKELELYNKDILKKNIIIIFNKIDLIGEDELKKKVQDFKKKFKKTPICISTATSEGIQQIPKLLFSILKN